MRIATFNVQNMRLRQTPDGPALDGAADRNAELHPDPATDLRDRELTAAVLARIDADILCLQEVFDTATLDHFHEDFLLPAGARPYPERHCLPGNDGHGLNVALMARIAPDRIVSHAGVRPADLGLEDPEGVLGGLPIFRRDCLEVWYGKLALFLCHLKAPYPDAERAAAIRAIEIAAIRRIVERAVPDPARSYWMVLGDLNETERGAEGAGEGLAPLLGDFGVDLMERLPSGEDWTFRLPETGARLRPDAMLASPALARACPEAVPQVERAGMDPETARQAGGIFAEVVGARPHASDHAAIWIDLADGLRGGA